MGDLQEVNRQLWALFILKQAHGKPSQAYGQSHVESNFLFLICCFGQRDAGCWDNLWKFEVGERFL